MESELHFESLIPIFRTCLTSRKRKLHELYSISFATVNIDAGDQSYSHDDGLAFFLKANDLQE